MRRRHIKSLVLFLLAGLLTTLGVAVLLAVVVDVQQGPQSEANAFAGDERWTVTRWDRAGAMQIRSTRTRGLSWSPGQAAGAPDTPTPGDRQTAWASQSPDGGMEWLILEYPKAVIPAALHVYESYSPGALFKVTSLDAAGTETEAWAGTNPSTAGLAPGLVAPGGVAISKVPLALKSPTSRIKIYLDSKNVPGWNEIDAVALIDPAGGTQWASRVVASSTYATGNMSNSGGDDPARLTPAWSGLDRSGPAFANALSNHEERIADARGWPLLALHSETEEANAAPMVLVSPSKSLNSLTFTGISGGGVSSAIAITTPAAPGVRPPFPTRPIWIGLAVNSVFYAICWMVIWMTLVVPRRFVRELARLRRGACVECGYDLGFDFIKGCPECGWRRTGREPGSR